MTVNRKPNRLINEKSPYLLQHAHNPVDWYPWGEAAFAEARRRDVPIFLSIGYSTCHWCHVMERESFENETVAAALNAAFVCLKVDREERPDIDTVYMNVCQALTGSGGWPLTIIMTADKQPFYAGTYFPPHSRYGRPGVIELTEAISKAWREDRQDLVSRAGQIVQQMRSLAAPTTATTQLDEDTLDKAYQYCKRTFDTTYGGFGQAPKFPAPHSLNFLLRYWRRTQDKQALLMVETTLEQMRRGGVYDQVGGGFHRYATDRQWLVPHFEKMLYDQALLAIAYTEAWQVTRRPDFAQTAQDILAYVLHDMQDPLGGFYAAEDADSEGEEGKFYVWTLDEIEQVLPPADAKLAIALFNISKEGNYLVEATQERNGTNILHLRGGLTELAAQHDMDEAELAERLQQIRQKLFEARAPRVHPFKDTKILTDWNGLMLAALALAGRAFGSERYLNAAANCAHFIRTHLTTATGLLKRWREGEAALPAQLDDYAFLIWGLIELHAATQEVKYLAWALELQTTMLSNYWDKEHSGFFLTASNAEQLIMRPKEIYDGAIPSGNSVAALNSLRLARLTGKAELEEYAPRTLQAFAGQIAKNPAAYSFALTALDFALGPTHEVVIVGEPTASDTNTMLQAIHTRFLPHVVLLLCCPEQPEKQDAIVKLAPFVQGLTAKNQQATAYVCSNFACQTPTNSVQELLAALR